MQSEPSGEDVMWSNELLFKPDLFSRPAAPAVPLPGDWEADHVEPIIRHYAHATGRLINAEVFGALPAPGRVANGATFRVVCEAGTFVLKIVLNQDVVRDIDRQIATMRAISTVSRLCPDVFDTDDGASSVKLPNDTAAYVMTCIGGRSFASSPAEIISAGQRLPEFLEATRNVPEAIRPQRRRNPYFTEAEEAGLTRLRHERARWPSAFGAQAAAIMERHWDSFERELARLRPFAAHLARQPSSFGHIDLHPGNLVSCNDTLAGVVDLDATFTAPAPLFAAFALLKLLKQVYVRAKDGEVTPAAANEAATAFRRDIYAHASAIGISPTELADTAKLEAIRRFLSVCQFGLDGREIPWNGPIVHFVAIAEADRLFT